MPRLLDLLPLLLALLAGAALAQQQQPSNTPKPDVCGFASTGAPPQLCREKPPCNGTCHKTTCQ